MSDDKQKDEFRALIEDSKELITVLTALLEKAEAKLDKTPPEASQEKEESQ